MKTLVLASGNAKKLRELESLLEPLQWQVRPQREYGVEDAEETGLTFVENAIIKARHAAQATGLPALADDSGIEVDYLDGKPGIYSARFAGPDATDKQNLQKLLSEMKQVPPEQRQCRYQCVLVLMRHAQDPTPLICQQSWEGVLLSEPHGDGGFGYDPIFHCPQHECSAAELSADQKNAVSHRGKALQQLLQHLSGG